MCCTRAGSWRKERTGSCWRSRGGTGPYGGHRPQRQRIFPSPRLRRHLQMGMTKKTRHFQGKYAMRNAAVLDLADCVEFRQALQARPPKIIHGTELLLIVLLGTALVWSAVTQADLVVRASGRVRPVTSLIKVFVPGRADMSSV